MKKTIFFIFLLKIFGVGGLMAAPKVVVKKGKDRIVYKKNTEINFIDRIVDGELVRPSGAYHQSRARAKFNSLIMYKKDFLKEMLKKAKTL